MNYKSQEFFNFDLKKLAEAYPLYFIERRIAIAELTLFFNILILIYSPVLMIKKIPSEINLSQSSLEINLYLLI